MKTSQSPPGQRSRPLKVELTLDLVKRLRLGERPVGTNAHGKLIFEPNPTSKPYIVWDLSRAAPPGFGLKVAGRKTYVIRRKVRGTSIMPTVGNVADFLDIALARKKAAALALQMVESGLNPNDVARTASAADLTLGEALARYRGHLEVRTQRPAKPGTLKVIDKVVRKFVALGWENRRVRDLALDEIEKKFEQGKVHASANEQAFRWVTSAVNWCVQMEKLTANLQGRQSVLNVNPFVVLVQNGAYRSNSQIERERIEKAKRSPLGPTTTLGTFLEVAWSKRTINNAETGVHYLILMLLWGCRTSEHAACRWGELLDAVGPPGKGLLTTSHVWLRDDGEYGPYVFFHCTKNGLNHRLPIGPMTLNLLRQRQISAAREVAERGFGAKSRPFVFPARSRFAANGHYVDATDLLSRIRDEAAIARLTRHDLRRSFGAMMRSLGVDEGIKRRFFNHASVDVTDKYTEAEWALLRSEITRIEQAILVTAPNVYNALKPVEWPPLPAPDPHVCAPAAPRSGRPPSRAASTVADS